MPPAAPPFPAEPFSRLIATLLAMVGARLERAGRPGLAGPLTLAIAIRLQRLATRLNRLVARRDAGTLTPLRRRRATPRRRTPPAPGPWDHLPPLPRGRAWFARLVPGAGIGAVQLRQLLDDPAMQDLLAAAPQAGRALRPLWHMLSGDPLPPILRRQEPAPAPAPSPPPAAIAAAAAHRPPPTNQSRPAPARPRPAPPPVPQAAAPA